jgi:hypothetical protein
LNPTPEILYGGSGDVEAKIKMWSPLQLNERAP